MNANLADAEAYLAVRLKKRAISGFAVDVDFETGIGFTVLFGASGAGKTTILDCIAGLQRPDEGQVLVGDAELFDSAASVNVPARRRNVGYLFQTLALFPHMTARQNIEYGLDLLTRDDRRRRVNEVAESFAISHVLERRPEEMSGGERQRVALARALVTRPRALLLDEPMTALDAATKARIIDDLRQWIGGHPVPVLYVTHDRDEVYALGDRVVVLEQGQVVAMGTPQDVLHRPQKESVAQLAGFENILNCEVTATHFEDGTMTCRVGETELTLEAPLTRLKNGADIRLGIRAGDILLASAMPEGLSARNVLSGVIKSLSQRAATVVAEVNCGVRLTVHLTPGAVRSLDLVAGKAVWIVVKTYSCHVFE